MIRHHPSPDVLKQYARGSLEGGMALVVACHVDGCEPCRREVAVWESLGGAFLQGAAPVALAENALARALARIDETTPVPEAKRKTPGFMERFSVPEPLRQQDIGFRRWVSPGIWFAPVHLRPASKAPTYLVYARQNTTLPQHTHRGAEFTSVLYGSFQDGNGTFGVGDFARTDESVFHAPAVTAQSECLCLIGAEAPMHLLGTAARIIQTLAGGLY